MAGRIGIGADLEQRADKRQRAVVNRVLSRRGSFRTTLVSASSIALLARCLCHDWHFGVTSIRATIEKFDADGERMSFLLRRRWLSERPLKEEVKTFIGWYRDYFGL
jgi:hypothetical protein